MIEVALPGQAARFYSDSDAAARRARSLQRHFRPRGLCARAGQLWTRMLDSLLLEEAAAATQVDRFSMSRTRSRRPRLSGSQVHIATEHFGQLDPLDLDEYLAHDGFAALRRCLEAQRRASAAFPPEQIIAPSKQSGLRGRGGAGFPPGKNGAPSAGQPGESNTSSATATKATRARSWTA